MKSFSVVAGLLLAGHAVAYPLESLFKRQSTNIDTTVLQFALTLEHLENVFYKEALEKFSIADFMAAGYSEQYYSDLKYISFDEQSHVQLLTSALTANGVAPNAACSYAFAFTDVKSFITLSSVLEGVGTSAYLGAAGLITSKAYLTVAGSILVAEALHTSMQRYVIGEVPMANPYGTPLSPNPVYTLAASFITSCPASNAALPFMAFPSLAATNGSPGASGMSYTFTAAKAPAAGSYLTFVSGLATVSVPAQVSGTTVSGVIPPGVSGQTYVFVTNTMVNSTIADSAIEYGPAILEVTPPAPAIDFSES